MTKEEIEDFQNELDKKGPCFVEGELSDQVVFSTFHRSGNTFMRKYFEMITGTLTGSAQNNTNVLNFSLFLSGFKGEGICDESTWFVKTHLPFPSKGILTPKRQIMGNKAIVCVRNPLDCCASLLHFFLTDTHSYQAGNDFNIDCPEFLDDHIKEFIVYHNRLLDFWIKVAQ